MLTSMCTSVTVQYLYKERIPYDFLEILKRKYRIMKDCLLCTTCIMMYVENSNLQQHQTMLTVVKMSRKTKLR